MELVDIMAEIDENPLLMPKLCKMLLGEEQKKKDCMTIFEAKMAEYRLKLQQMQFRDLQLSGDLKLLILASMINIDEDSLICDFAEIYHIYDYRSCLKTRRAAIFAARMRETSRIRMKLSGEQTSRDLFMQAVIADRLGMICYALSEKSAEKPVSLVNLLLGKVEMEDVRKDVVTFDTPEEFENAWKGGTE